MSPSADESRTPFAAHDHTRSLQVLHRTPIKILHGQEHLADEERERIPRQPWRGTSPGDLLRITRGKKLRGGEQTLVRQLLAQFQKLQRSDELRDVGERIAQGQRIEIDERQLLAANEHLLKTNRAVRGGRGNFGLRQNRLLRGEAIHPARDFIAQMRRKKHQFRGIVGRGFQRIGHFRPGAQAGHFAFVQIRERQAEARKQSFPILFMQDVDERRAFPLFLPESIYFFEMANRPRNLHERGVVAAVLVGRAENIKMIAALRVVIGLTVKCALAGLLFGPGEIDVIAQHAALARHVLHAVERDALRAPVVFEAKFRARSIDRIFDESEIDHAAEPIHFRIMRKAPHGHIQLGPKADRLPLRFAGNRKRAMVRAALRHDFIEAFARAFMRENFAEEPLFDFRVRAVAQGNAVEQRAALAGAIINFFDGAMSHFVARCGLVKVLCKMRGHDRGIGHLFEMPQLCVVESLELHDFYDKNYCGEAIAALRRVRPSESRRLRASAQSIRDLNAL